MNRSRSAIAMAADALIIQARLNSWYSSCATLLIWSFISWAGFYGYLQDNKQNKLFKMPGLISVTRVPINFFLYIFPGICLSMGGQMCNMPASRIVYTQFTGINLCQISGREAMRRQEILRCVSKRWLVCRRINWTKKLLSARCQRWFQGFVERSLSTPGHVRATIFQRC